jgi:hypothetical protein
MRIMVEDTVVVYYNTIAIYYSNIVISIYTWLGSVYTIINKYINKLLHTQRRARNKIID